MDHKLYIWALFICVYFVKTAEEYLTEAEGEATDVESVVTEKSNTESELSSNYGKLKHSDSLLLLTQVMQDPRLLWELRWWTGNYQNLLPLKSFTCYFCEQKNPKILHIFFPLNIWV